MRKARAFSEDKYFKNKKPRRAYLLQIKLNKMLFIPSLKTARSISNCVEVDSANKFYVNIMLLIL